MAYPILGTPKPAYYDSNGAPLVSGTITITNPSDDTAKTVYPSEAQADASSGGSTAAITLNSRGEPPFQIWGQDNEDYKVVLKDSAAATIWTIASVQMPPHPKGRHLVTMTTDDATPSSADGDYVRFNDGTDSITGIDDGFSGKVVTLSNYGTTARLLAHGSNIKLRDVNAGGMSIMEDDHIMLISDGSAVWYELARSQKGPLLATKTADQTVTASTTLVDDTHMSAYKLAPESIYKISGFLKVNTGATSAPDIKLALQTDQTFQDSWWTLHSTNDAAAIVGDTGITTTAIELACVTGTVHGIVINGFVQTHATAIATVDLQWAQGTSDAIATTVELGSWLQFELIRSD